MTGFRLGIDVGGTFTDIVLLGDDGTILTMKVSSTPDDYSRAILQGVRAASKASVFARVPVALAKSRT